jgi:hypothetical protein
MKSSLEVAVSGVLKLPFNYLKEYNLFNLAMPEELKKPLLIKRYVQDKQIMPRLLK